jgi:hypothetical protein
MGESKNLRAIEKAKSKIKDAILDIDIISKKLNLQEEKDDKTKPGS